MINLPERIRSTKAQLRIATRQYNQAARLLARLTKSLEQLERRNELARSKRKAKSAK